MHLFKVLVDYNNHTESTSQTQRDEIEFILVFTSCMHYLLIAIFSFNNMTFEDIDQKDTKTTTINSKKIIFNGLKT